MWWVERLGIGLLWSGMFIYTLVLAYLHVQESGSRLTQIGFICLGAGLFYIRWITIRKFSYQPRTDRE